jgi:hypothetical protein
LQPRTDQTPSHAGKPPPAGPFRDYDAFWRFYLSQHARPGTRLLHYAGTSAALGCLLTALLLRDWRWLAAAPVVGYAMAWLAHGMIEGNRPATFGHPLWSLVSDFRMLWLAASGRLSAHLDRS